MNTKESNSDQTDNTKDGGMCQLFEIKEAKSEWKTCPTKMDDLKPISFKGFKDGKPEQSFPGVFLFAVKYKNRTLADKGHTHSEIFVGNHDTENKKLMTIYTNNMQNSFWHKCENIN